MRHFIIGDIHGCSGKLEKLLLQIVPLSEISDRFIFCGDYIDRGDDSFGTLELLSSFSKEHDAVFLSGNHETLLKGYLSGEPEMERSYLSNGGIATIKSYSREFGSLYIPDSHASILFSEKYIYEGTDFFVVHAGLDPQKPDPMDTSPFDCVWLRERFYRSGHVWDKTVIFGHTPTQYMGLQMGTIFVDDRCHLIGIDTGAVYGGVLTCLVWPDRRIFQV